MDTLTCWLTFTSVWKALTGIVNICGREKEVLNLVNLDEFSLFTLDCSVVSLNGFSTLKSILHSSTISEFSVSSQCSALLGAQCRSAPKGLHSHHNQPYHPQTRHL